MATILARMLVKPGKEREFEQIARDLYSASHGSEPALRYYEYWRGQEERVYYTLLAFDDHRGFIHHQTSDHHEDAAPRIREAVESVHLEFIDPIVGASSLPPTEHQAAPADADELTASYTERLAAQIADWWGVLREGPPEPGA